MEFCRGIIIEDGYVLDPFIHEEKWIYRSVMTMYFQEMYELTLQQVYNLATGHDIDYNPTCPICGKKVAFRGLAGGYQETCSLSHSVKLCMEDGRISINKLRIIDADVMIESARRKFIKAGDPNDICRFYISKYKQYYKFGITSKSVEERNSWNRGLTINPHCIVVGNRVDIANLEARFKLRYELYEEICN